MRPICTVGSVIGGIAGYAIGYFLLEYIGQPILQFYGYARQFAQVPTWFNEWGVWILIIKGMTPFPYKVLTIAAGAVAHGPRAVHPGQHRCARHALLPGGGAALLVRRADPRVHRASV